MNRLRQLTPCLLFAALMVSAVACVPASHGHSLPLMLVCSTACWSSFVALAIWVSTHTRHAPPSDQTDEPVSAPPSLAVVQIQRLTGLVRASVSSFPPGRRRKRWEKFEREFWSKVDDSAKLPRAARNPRPPE
jgi:hypothetical protein